MSLHGDAEQCDEVHDEDRPEDRDVEELEEGAEEGDQGRLRGRVPELELREASGKTDSSQRNPSNKDLSNIN